MSSGAVVHFGSIVAFCASVLCLQSSVHAGGFAVGREVLQKSREFSLKDGDKPVTCTDMVCPFRIRKVDGERLYLAALGKKGWAPASSVVLVRDAEAYFSAALQTKPRDSFAYLMRGIVRAEESPEEDDSLADFDEAIRLDAGNVDAYLCRALLWLERKNVDRSLLDCNAALQIAPANPYALVSRGVCLSERGASGPASTDFEKAFSLCPREAGLLLHRGWLWQNVRQPATALADFDRCILLDPGLSDAHGDKAALLVEQGEYDRALPEFDQAIRLEPENPQFYLQRGNCRALKKEPGTALADFDAAIRIDAEIADAYRMRAQAWRDNGNFDRAIKDVSEAIRLDPGDSSDLDTRGVLWQLKGEFDRALADCTEAIRSNANDAQAFYQRAVLLYWRKNLPAQALEDLTAALRIDPKHIGALAERARICATKHDFDSAIADLSLAIKLEPKDAVLLFTRGCAWQAKRSFRQALDDFDESVRLAPDGQGAGLAYNARAWIRATCPDAAVRNGTQAVESATRACKETLWNEPGCLITLAAAYAEKGDFDAAVKWAEKAVSLIPSDHPSHPTWRGSVEQFKQQKPVRDPQ
jgi:tetratricopeptide (TPR) repeat protein